MAVPKKKVSKARRDRRRAHNFRLVAPNLSVCPTCKSRVLPHHVCPTCGQYQGRQVINMEPAAEAK
jgi:large subunit ribosomal protein L32